MTGMQALLLYSALVLLASTEYTTTRFVDPIGTICKEGMTSMTRVRKEVDITFKYSLSNSNTWQQFQGMDIEFYLNYAQFVDI